MQSNRIASGLTRSGLDGFVGRIGKEWVIFPTTIVSMFGLGSTTFGIAFYAKDALSAGPAAVGQFAGIWALSYIFGCLTLGPWMSRRVPPRLSLLIAMASMGCTLSLVLSVRSVAPALLFYGLYGFSTSFFFPPLVSWLTTGVESRELGRATSRFSLSWSVGSIAAPWIGSRLLVFGVSIPLIFSVAVYAVVGVFLVIANTRFPLIRGDSVQNAASNQAAPGDDRSTPLRYPAWTMLFACYVLNGLITAHWPVYLRDSLGFRPDSIGLMFLVRSATLTAVFIALSRFVGWHFRRRMLVFSALGALGSVFALWAAKSGAGLTAALVANALAQGLAYNGAIFYAVSGAANRNRRAAINESILNAGSFTGAVGSGYLLETQPMGFVLAAVAALLGAAAVLQVWQLSVTSSPRRSTPRPSSSPPPTRTPGCSPPDDSGSADSRRAPIRRGR